MEDICPPGKQLCAEGCKEGAVNKGKTWLIPEDARKPADGRYMDKSDDKVGKQVGILELTDNVNKTLKDDLLQLPELTDEKSEAYKAGYKNICEIGKERIRRAAKKIREENPNAVFDGGFRVLKLDSSNMKDVYYNPADTQQTLMDMFADNIKEDRTPKDRTPEDLLFQVMLDLGVLLSSKIEETEIAGKKVFNVADGFLIACFDKDVTEETVKAVAAKKPYYAVFRDSSMANDSVATNFDQIFASISPETIRRVL